MASVLGLLEAREKKVREEVARLRVALDAAEQQLERLADARVTVAEVLAEPVMKPQSWFLSVPAGPGAVGGMRVSRSRRPRAGS